jgi:VRR-NUC domain
VQGSLATTPTRSAAPKRSRPRECNPPSLRGPVGRGGKTYRPGRSTFRRPRRAPAQRSRAGSGFTHAFADPFHPWRAVDRPHGLSSARLMTDRARSTRRPVPPAVARQADTVRAPLDTADWIKAIGARSLGKRPFVARRRRLPALALAHQVEHFEFPFKRWDGAVGEWREHFGKGRGQVHSLDGKPPLRSCNEIEVAKALRSVRDCAFWFSGYSPGAIPKLWRQWVQTFGAESSSWLASLDREVRLRIHSKRGGMPDVVAWNEDDPLASAIFVECKGRGEPIAEAQEDWVSAAQRAGIRPVQVAVSVRPF